MEQNRVTVTDTHIIKNVDTISKDCLAAYIECVAELCCGRWKSAATRVCPLAVRVQPSPGPHWLRG
jgi:hypothetical protein